jgi:hypothetical protein
MVGGNPSRINDHSTVHKDEGDTDFPELVEPEALNVVIDGITPSDYLDNGKRKRFFLRVLLVIFALAAISVTMGVSFGLTGKNDSPHAPQTTTKNPTPSPSSPPSSSVVAEFFSGLPSYSLDAAENDADSPQAKALTWLQKDPKFNEYKHSYRLYQRYALAVLYYSTNGTSSWEADRGWLSNDNECGWYMNDEVYLADLYGVRVCSASFRLSMLTFSDNNLAGSLPIELELLTDVWIMSFSDANLSGTFHSEL